MTDVSGVTTNTAGSTQQEPATAYVTIRQPDGSTYRIPQSKAIWDPASESWQSAPSAEASELAKTINRKHGMQLDADDFMGLLVAQLRYQDPSKPADTAAMMQQTASMAMVERVNELAGAAESMTKSSEALAKANEQLVQSNTAMTQHLGALLAQQSLAAAIGLIGQKVDYTDPAGGEDAASKTGVVESVKVGADGPIITVNGQDVPIANVTGVARAGDTAATGDAPAAEEPATGDAPAPTA